MIRILTFLLALAPGMAQALSCLAPNPARELDWLVEDGHAMAVVIGTLGRDEAVPDRKGHANIWIAYRLTGERLMPGGTAVPFDAEISYRSDCLAPWCGAIPESGEAGLFLLRLREGRPAEVETGPCGGGHYPPPSDAARRVLGACLDAGRCGEAGVSALEPR